MACAWAAEESRPRSDAFGDGVHALYLPYQVQDPATARVISITRAKIMDGFGANVTLSPLADHDVDKINEMRANLIESVITEAGDEDLMEHYLEGEEVDFSKLSADLAVAIGNAE